MGIINKKFYASAIVGGVLPIALGVALSIKKRKKNKVWIFIGDMTYETGIFRVYKYSKILIYRLDLLLKTMD